MINKFNFSFLLGIVDDVKPFVRDSGQNWYSISLKVPYDYKDLNQGCNWFRVSYFGEEQIVKKRWVLVIARLGINRFSQNEEVKYRVQLTANQIIDLNSLVVSEFPSESSDQILDDLKKRIDPEDTVRGA